MKEVVAEETTAISGILGECLLSTHVFTTREEIDKVLSALHALTDTDCR